MNANTTISNVQELYEFLSKIPQASRERMQLMFSVSDENEQLEVMWEECFETEGELESYMLFSVPQQMAHVEGYVPIDTGKEYGMERYVEDAETQKWVRIDEIRVPNEYDKEQLLKAINYFHDLRNIDTDFLAVNTLAHVYCRPELITVTSKE